jgi:hypothetical protein
MRTFARLVDGLTIFFACALLVAVAVGSAYHVGFRAGLNEKVGIVGERYVMKVKGGR